MPTFCEFVETVVSEGKMAQELARGRRFIRVMG